MIINLNELLPNFKLMIYFLDVMHQISIIFILQLSRVHDIYNCFINNAHQEA
jgi:hypothetical protein